MQRTIDNCTLIQKCEGYQRGEDDDEPCEQCKECKFCIYGKDYEN